MKLFQTVAFFVATTEFISNHLYEFSGQKLRYSHESNCGLLAQCVFTNSSLRRKELNRAIRY